ncbi:MAG: hypothetical protein LR008_00325, partial [Candidatus Pacebacteria bacterium]|nr:hypothetical protein [Candidatus Paceibacterota bacterium]
MQTKTFFTSLLVAGFIATSSTVSASTLLYTELHDYGISKYDPGGNDPLKADSVKVKDSSSSRFYDSFDLSGITGTIDRIELTLDFKKAGPFCPLGICALGETWSVRAQGSNSSTASDDSFGQLSDVLSPQTFVYSAATDTGTIDTFLASILSGEFEFWFSEGSIWKDAFNLDTAEINVYGVSEVSLPAAAFLFGPALLGLSGYAEKA